MSDVNSALPRPQTDSLIQRLSLALTAPYVVGIGARVGGQIIAFALIMIAARYLSLAEFGTYALAAAAGVIATTFVFTGLYHALLRSTDLAADIDTLFWLQSAVGFLGTAAILGVGVAFGGLATDIGQALIVTSLLPLLAVPNAWNEAQLVRASRVRAASLYVLGSECVGFVVTIVLLREDWGLYALIAGRYATVLAALGMTCALVRRWPRLMWRSATASQSAETALPLWGTTGIGMFSAYGADIVLAAYLNPAAVGAFRSGARIATTASSIIFQPLTMLSWSRFSRLEHEGDTQGISHAWQANMALSCALLWPIMAGVALVADDLVVTLFDESWAAAAPVLAVLCLSHIVASPQALTEPVLVCVKRPKLQFALRAMGGLILLAGLLTLGQYGATQAAWAIVLTAGVTTTVVLAVLYRILGLTALGLLRTFAPATLLAGVVILSVVALAPTVAAMPDATGLTVHVLCGAALWSAGLALFIRRGTLVVPSP